MKRIFLAALVLFMVPAAFAARPVPVSAGILEQFNHNFPKSENVVWTENATSYEAHFLSEGVRCWLILDKKDGDQLWLVRYYAGSKLPSDLQKDLHIQYPDADIRDVTEINNGDVTVYQVNLETKNKWYIVTMDNDGNMKLKDSFNKS